MKFWSKRWKEAEAVKTKKELHCTFVSLLGC